MVKKIEAMCNRLDSIPACDGARDSQTDRQTDGRTSCDGIVRSMHTRRAVKTLRDTDIVNRNTRDIPTPCSRVSLSDLAKYSMKRDLFYVYLSTM